MSKLIVVVGATGNQGGSVVRTFEEEHGWKVRAITRDTSKASAQALATEGVEVVAADLHDPASLRAAFVRAHVIFGVTDFWQFAQDPTTYKMAAEQNVLPNQICYQRELVHAKNIIDAAATIPSLERFIFSTLSDSKKWSDGKITKNLHFDGKAEASKYIETQYPDLAAKTSSLQVGMYLTNHRISPILSPKKAADGKNFVMRKPSVQNPKLCPFVHPTQDVGPFVKALVLKAPPKTTMLGYSQKASWDEYCDIWTRVMRERGLIASDASLQQDNSMTIEEVAQSMPGGFGEEIAASFVYAGEYGYDGSDPDVKSPEECGVDLAQLSSIESFVRSEDWSQWLDAQPAVKI